MSGMILVPCKLAEIGAEHIGHPVGMTRDVRFAALRLREPFADLAQRRLDQLAGERARRIRGSWEGLPHEGRDDALACCSRVPRLGRVAIERCGVTERAADR